MVTDNLTPVQLMSYEQLREIQSENFGWIGLMSLWNSGAELNKKNVHAPPLSLGATNLNYSVLNVNDLVEDNNISYQLMKDVNDRYFIIEKNGKRTSKKGPISKKEIESIFLPLISFENYKKQKK